VPATAEPKKNLSLAGRHTEPRCLLAARTDRPDMERERQVLGVAATMVVLGLAQVAWGLRGGDLVYAALGAAFAAIGVGFAVVER
jgi:hypothetical protein